MPRSHDDTSFNSFDCELSSHETEFKKLIQNPYISKPQSTNARTEKCKTPYLSTDEKSKSMDGFSRKPCFNLICKRCDIYVKHYKDKKWTENIDYLFFRSYFGNFEKIKEKLIECKGSLAFHCGCIGVSIKTPRPADGEGGVNWICYGH